SDPLALPDSLRLFFHYLADHRLLHSFPTRRSSDLHRVASSHVLELLRPERKALRDHARSALPLPERAACRGARAPHVRHQRGRRDRKSTRLNSSHVKISYAVFCLKKKKKEKKKK